MLFDGRWIRFPILLCFISTWLHNIPWYETRNAPSEIYLKLDRLFPLVILTSHRWDTFIISTFHPAVFRHVQRAFSDTSADTLCILELDYSYMPGYSLLDISGEATCDLPFVLPFGLIDWLRVGLFDALVEIKLVYICVASALNWSIFQELLQVAVRLECVQLDDLSPFAIPSEGYLELPSVRRLDVAFPEDSISSHMIDFVEHFQFPNLCTAVARSFVWTDIGQLPEDARSGPSEIGLRPDPHSLPLSPSFLSDIFLWVALTELNLA
ncbi:hypothetical protein B0H13DRAFT_2368947 [Mycena leptocephala]|nr:hypothetical protein B0H13DRAFT_2368947 [Mycena leptocephala]